jgi:DNA-binding transcriptional LysR family regulator
MGQAGPSGMPSFPRYLVSHATRNTGLINSALIWSNGSSGICTLAVYSLLEEGLGLGILPCHLGDASPRLRRISPLLPEFRSQLWLLTPRQLRGVPKVSATLECLTTGLRELKDLFEGRLAGRAS